MIPPQILYIGAPFLIAAVCDWLQHDTLPRRTNAVIVLATTAIIATLWALLTGQFVGSLAADASIVTIGSFAILSLPQLAGLNAWLCRVLVSPFSLLPSARIVDAVPASPAKSPAPITLRASTLGAGQSWMQRRDDGIVDAAPQSSEATQPLSPTGLRSVVPVTLREPGEPTPSQPAAQQPGEPQVP